ncbi:MAG TPA: GNAT family protein [Candidatus Nanopelagicaceae bacterium]|nr:GNAT family protein [Candidatus Nanopelagicaceae bacterium]
MNQNVWPLFQLRVTTPKLELRYVDDELGFELAKLSTLGIHDPDFMPFTAPWTDADSQTIQPNTMKYYWRCRAETEPNHWDLPFAVIAEGQVVGSAALAATDFPILRQFETGSWLGRTFQGRGWGGELRQAAIHLGFEGFGAKVAMTAAFSDNAPSLGVTRSLGYAVNGSSRKLRRGKSAESHSFMLNFDEWSSRLRRSDISITGLDPCASFLGLRE